MSCPVACSKTSSFLEIGGKAVYFDPNSAELLKIHWNKQYLMIKN